jgi:hypothetical protein
MTATSKETCLPLLRSPAVPNRPTRPSRRSNPSCRSQDGPNVFGAWQALGTTALALAHTGERTKCADLYPTVLEWVATGHKCETITLGPVNPQLVAAVTARAAGLRDKAREHSEIARREAQEIPYRILQPAVDYWQGRMLAEDIAGPERSAGLAMVQAALKDFRALGMVLHANIAEQFLQSAQ